MKRIAARQYHLSQRCAPLVGYIQFRAFLSASEPRLNNNNTTRKEDAEELEAEKRLRAKFEQKGSGGGSYNPVDPSKIKVPSFEDFVKATGNGKNLPKNFAEMQNLMKQMGGPGASTGGNTQQQQQQGSQQSSSTGPSGYTPVYMKRNSGHSSGNPAADFFSKFIKYTAFFTCLYAVVLFFMISRPNSQLSAGTGLPMWSMTVEDMCMFMLMGVFPSFSIQRQVRADFLDAQKQNPMMSFHQFMQQRYPTMFQGNQTSQMEIIAAMSACLLGSNMDVMRFNGLLTTAQKNHRGDTKSAIDGLMSLLKTNYPAVFNASGAPLVPNGGAGTPMGMPMMGGGMPMMGGGMPMMGAAMYPTGSPAGGIAFPPPGGMPTMGMQPYMGGGGPVMSGGAAPGGGMMAVQGFVPPNSPHFAMLQQQQQQLPPKVDFHTLAAAPVAPGNHSTTPFPTMADPLQKA